MLFAGIDVEAGRMDIGAGTGEHDAVDGIEKRTDIGDVGRAREHHRQATGHLGHGAQVSLTDHLDLKTIFDAMGVPDHADDRLFHLPYRAPRRRRFSKHAPRMGQIQQKGSRDGNAIFAQMPGRRSRWPPFAPRALAPGGRGRVKPAAAPA